jgi:hypothetical protein
MILSQDKERWVVRSGDVQAAGFLTSIRVVTGLFLQTILGQSIPAQINYVYRRPLFETEQFLPELSMGRDIRLS